MGKVRRTPIKIEKIEIPNPHQSLTNALGEGRGTMDMMIKVVNLIVMVT